MGLIDPGINATKNSAALAEERKRRIKSLHCGMHPKLPGIEFYSVLDTRGRDRIPLSL
jgi:hypothetical protein